MHDIPAQEGQIISLKMNENDASIHTMSKNMIKSFWIDFDCYDVGRIVFQFKGQTLDMPFDDFMNILRVYFKKI